MKVLTSVCVCVFAAAAAAQVATCSSFLWRCDVATTSRKWRLFRTLARWCTQCTARRCGVVISMLKIRLEGGDAFAGTLVCIRATCNVLYFMQGCS